MEREGGESKEIDGEREGKEKIEERGRGGRGKLKR